jgi:hypothetical protein
VSGCTHAVDDTSIRLISNLKDLKFLDFSFCKKVTDAGLVHFEEKKLPIQTLCLSGATGLGANGITAILNCCTATLVDFEAAYLDNEEMKHTYLQKVAFCWNLELLDLAGCTSLDDMAIQLLGKGEAKMGETVQKPGLA